MGLDRLSEIPDQLKADRFMDDLLSPSFPKGTSSVARVLIARRGIVAQFSGEEDTFFKGKITDLGTTSLARIVTRRFDAAEGVPDTPEVRRGIADMYLRCEMFLAYLEDAYPGLARAPRHEKLRVLRDEFTYYDAATANHCVRSGDYVSEINNKLSVPLPTDEVEQVATLAQLHDLGKIGVRRAILNRTSSLSSAERHVVREHSVSAAYMLHRLNFDRADIKTILYYHEKFDGLGYPVGLRGTEIPLQAHLLLAGDSIDANRTGKPYRKPKTQPEIIALFEMECGKQFSPEMAEAGKAVLIDYEKKAQMDYK